MLKSFGIMETYDFNKKVPHECPGKCSLEMRNYGDRMCAGHFKDFCINAFKLVDRHWVTSITRTKMRCVRTKDPWMRLRPLPPIVLLHWTKNRIFPFIVEWHYSKPARPIGNFEVEWHGFAETDPRTRVMRDAFLLLLLLLFKLFILANQRFEIRSW